ncbi:MAG: phosphate regulon sensor histidine kinase PhoR [Burkholderiales bacterium]
MNLIWARNLATLAIILAFALAGWVLFGALTGLGVLAFGALLLVFYHTYHLEQLERWTQSEMETPVPLGHGTWEQAFAGIYQRVRRRKEAEQSLASALMRLQEASEAMPDGLVILSRDDRIEWLNQRAIQHLGLDREHDINQPLANLARQPEIVEFLAQGNFGEPLVVKSARDQRLTLALQIIPYGAEQKLLVTRDVSKLEEVETLRRDFIANVSHELRTPLTVLCGFLETLEDLAPDDPDLPRFLNLMQAQAGNMQRLVNDLLTLSQLESSQNPLREEPVDVAKLMQRMQSDAQALSAGAHRIKLQIDSLSKVLGNEAELASAFGNLASNAVRYTPQGGDINLRWYDNGNGAVFEVRDTGIGIPAEHIPRVTERFYRVDRGRSRDSGGTGLGLAIVKHVVLRHQAELAVDSTPGKGSTFAIHFPASRCLR